MNLRLTDVHADMIALDEMLIEVGGDVTDPGVSAYIDGCFAEMETNAAGVADRYCGLMREKRLRAAAMRDEADRLASLAAAETNAADAMQARLQWFFENHGILNMKTARFNLTMAKHGGKLPLIIPDVRELPASFIDVQPIAKKDEIRAALEAGETVNGATLGERGTSLRIK